MQPRTARKKAGIKAFLLVTLIVSGVLIVRYTPLRDFLTAEQLAGFMDRVGAWAPLVFMLIYAVGVCLFVPGTVLGAIGAVLFGAGWGFVYVWIGAMAGATAAFFIGRFLGREFAASLIGDKLRKYDDAIERNGFATVLYLRLVYFPFTPMNFGMGLTKVRLSDYVVGTGLGIIVGTFIFIFFIGTLKEVWTRRDWAQLLSWKVLFSLGLFVFSLFIPPIAKRLRGERDVSERPVDPPRAEGAENHPLTRPR